MTLTETLRQLPTDYEIVLRPVGGTVEYTDTAGNWLTDDGRLHRLEDYELACDIHLPGRNGYPIPADRRPYRQGDIGGHINPPADVILRGPIGDWLTAVEPETEATIPSLGAGLLAGLGAYMGRGIRLKVGRIHHTPNIFAVQVGPTGTARKGTADGEIQRFLREMDRSFAYDNIASGFGSGEALIERVADPVRNSKDEIIAGTEDQRLYIQEAEFSKVLRIADRQGSILSDVIRLAFDATRPLANAAKTSRKLKSSNHCISLFGGITPEELVRIFPALAAVSGTGNRYLWVWSDSDKLLPTGGAEVDVSHHAARVRTNITQARSPGTLEYSAGGHAWWQTHYPTLRQGTDVPETVRPMVTRMSDQVQRIALIYAATEGAAAVTEDHLEAGLAWVTHSVQTVQAVLGGLVRNQEAGRILAALRQHPGVAAGKSELWDLFSRNITATALDAALEELEKAGLAFSWTGPSVGPGRPPVMVIATTPEAESSDQLIRSYHEKPRKTKPKSSFVQTSQNGGNRQLVVEKSEYEKKGFEDIPPIITDPLTKEVIPDDQPDPW